MGTPFNRDGSVNLKQIETVAQQIARYLNEYKVIVNKSTVPVGTAAKILHIIEEHQSKTYKKTPDSVIEAVSQLPLSLIKKIIKYIKFPPIRKYVLPVPITLSVLHLPSEEPSADS